ncbi:MAG: alpha/beta hydrolase [Anaerolineales bacterium]|nr:alpha/beta hydrolase [Anaerolineales bacterium]
MKSNPDPSIHLREAWAPTGAYRTFYRTAGSGPALILLHGAGGEGSHFLPILPPLAASHTVIIPDILGHGRSQGPPIGYTHADYTRWLASLMDATDLPAADLVGHSHGGSIALRYAHTHPGRVNRLVLVNSISLGPPSLQGTLKLLRATFSRSPRRSRELAGQVMFSGTEAERREKAEQFLSGEDAIRKGVPGFLWMFARTWQTGMPTARRRLRELRTPTMLIWGEDDSYFRISHARRASGLIPRCQVVTVSGAAHAPFVERPEKFNRLLLSFLEAGAADQAG